MIYLAFYLILVIIYLLYEIPFSSYPKTDRIEVVYKYIILSCGIVFIFVLVGLRLEVGGDWWNYLVSYETYSTREFSQLSIQDDPFYGYLNIVANRYDLGIVFVNSICGIIFCFGFLKISVLANPENPIFVLLILFPVMIVIIGLGYTRQSVALALSLLSVEYYIRNNLLRSLMFALLASGFHASALIIFMVIGGLMINKYIIFIVPLLFFSVQMVISRIDYYIDNEIESGGVAFRLFINLVPSLIFLFTRKSVVWSGIYRRYIYQLSIGTVILFFAVVIISSSVVIDRIAFYLIPLQYLVYSRLPNFFTKKSHRVITNLLVISTYFGILIGVIFFSAHFYGWLPYRNYLFNL